MNQQKICTACGTQFPAGEFPELCTICLDDRQYIPEEGQTWTTHDDLIKKNSVRINKINDKLYELEISPRFAIGQRAFLILSDNGNILWDCISLLDEPTIDFIKSKGGLKAIAISHPHYYSNMNNWAETFNCPIYIHRSDEQWIMDKGKHISLWGGVEKSLWEGIRIINIGGHFPGSGILHVPFLSQDGTVFCGDTLYLSPSKKHLAVMYSYPNRIPLPLYEVERIKKQFENIAFDTLYGFYSYQNLTKNVKEILKMSMDRYLEDK
jgi:hypothetical protein